MKNIYESIVNFLTSKDSPGKIVKSIVFILMLTFSSVIGGITAGCYLAIAMLGPIPFLIMVATEICIIILSLLYYKYLLEGEFW